MSVFILAVTLVVPDYDDAIRYYCGSLGFELVEDTMLSPGKRFVRVAPHGSQTALLLAQAEGEPQSEAIGYQTGGRVSFFLQTDNFARDHLRFSAAGVEFLEEPRKEPHGTVAVFRDPFGNKWDLIEPAA